MPPRAVTFTVCAYKPRTHLGSFFAFVAITILLSIPLPAYPWDQNTHQPYKRKASSYLIEGNLGYLLGYNEIRFREGDNYLFPPGKKEVQLDSPLFGLMAGAFFTKDLGLRGRAWINIPFDWRTDFYIDSPPRGWDTRAKYLEADLTAIYQFDLAPMPYIAGIEAGYKYIKLDYESYRIARNSETFYDHIHIHIPYLGVYYAHENLAGALVRLDIIGSPFALSRLDAEEHLTESVIEIEGHTITGTMFETLFAWSKEASDTLMIGGFARYYYLDMSGGATLKSSTKSTRFSMDSRHNVVVIGLGITYMF